MMSDLHLVTFVSSYTTIHVTGQWYLAVGEADTLNETKHDIDTPPRT